MHAVTSFIFISRCQGYSRVIKSHTVTVTPFTVIYRIACNFRGVKISFILKKEIFVSKNFVLPGSGRGRRRPTRFFVGEKFRGGQLHSRK